jgi:2,3-bisphosphoglycerate-dependent phosphoglycerate mutase
VSTLVLVRHGQSDWNADVRFAGWVDVDLTSEGERQAIQAAELLRANGIAPTSTYTSVLRRAQRTGSAILASLAASSSVCQSWRLNERHYGALQGMTKAQVLREYGAERFRQWRRSYDVAPPPISLGSPWDVPRDRPYFELEPAAIPRSESLADVTARLLPFWHEHIAADLRAGSIVLLVGHSNSLRAMAAYLDRLGGSELMDLNIPTAQPLVYDLDQRLLPIVRGGRYLDPRRAAAAAQAVAVEGQGHELRTEP